MANEINLSPRYPVPFDKKLGPGNPYQPGNPYFQVKQAFLEDKAAGFQGCLTFRPRADVDGKIPDSEVCMGRATKALIQSDYFPW